MTCLLMSARRALSLAQDGRALQAFIVRARPRILHFMYPCAPFELQQVTPGKSASTRQCLVLQSASRFQPKAP